MARIVMKFGGTSVANISCIAHAAHHVKREFLAGHEIVVVVSAMAGKTDALFSFVQEIASTFDPAEYDSIVSSGEQVSAGLFALSLQNIGLHGRSWQGWQIPIITNTHHGCARIIDVNCVPFLRSFEKKEIPVIAGFQGMTSDHRITTLGRGGSDITAVAIAAAIQADRCDIYTDVDGIYTADPRIEEQARKVAKISYEEMLEIASLGAKVLQVRCVELAMQYKVRLLVRSSFEDPELLRTDSDILLGTLICDEEEIMEQGVVVGVSYTKDEASISFRCLSSWSFIVANVFKFLADENINIDMIVQTIAPEEKGIDITFTIPALDLQKTMDVLEKICLTNSLKNITYDKSVAKISIIGIGMRSHAGVAAKAFQALAEAFVAIHAVGTSEIKISFLVDESQTKKAVQALHAAFELNKIQPNFL